MARFLRGGPAPGNRFFNFLRPGTVPGFRKFFHINRKIWHEQLPCAQILEMLPKIGDCPRFLATDFVGEAQQRGGSRYAGGFVLNR
jgi:hypothetical protein